MAKPKKGANKSGGRRSRAESMTGAKANSVEVRTAASIGDNSQLKLPAPKDFDHHYKSIRGAQDKVKTAQALSSQASESANKCSPGMAKVIKDTIKIENENDPAKLQRHLEMLGMGLKHIDSSIQISIFDTLAGDQMDQVYRRYFRDGKDAKPLDNRYPEGSDLFAQAARAWRHGNAANMNLTPQQADEALEDEMSDAERRLPPPPAVSAEQSVSLN